ncbi:MAG: hypothetical protein IPG72_04815 [Ardenticatenales bacterium]|nr:hypothetical protein [Ardenticatenales bacterium]
MSRLWEICRRAAVIGAAGVALGAMGTLGSIERPTFAQNGSRVFNYLPLVLRGASRNDIPAAATAHPATAAPTATRTAAAPTASPTEPPPTATPTLDVTLTPTPGIFSTDEPTQTPPPTATLTPVPTSDGRVCRELTTNGDFEKGPNEWDLQSGFRARTLSQIIRKAEPNTIPRPTWGEYFAALGGGSQGVVETITHPGRPLRLWTTIQSSRLISASLSFDFTMLTEEVPNRRDDDTLQPIFLSQDGVEEAVKDAVASEESVPLAPVATWKRFGYDVTRHVVVRPGWERFQLQIKSRMSENVPTWHYIDEISLIVCEKGPMP